MSAIGSPHHKAQAESFIKTSKVEDIYQASYDTFADVAERLPTFIDESTIPGVYIRHLDTDHHRNLKINLPSKRLSLKRPVGEPEGFAPL